MLNFLKRPTKVIIEKIKEDAFFIVKNSTIEIFSAVDKTFPSDSSIMTIPVGILLNTSIKYLDMNISLSNKIENKLNEAYYTNLPNINTVLTDNVYPKNNIAMKELGVIISTNARIIKPINIYKFEKIGTITFPCKVDIIEKD